MQNNIILDNSQIEKHISIIFFIPYDFVFDTLTVNKISSFSEKKNFIYNIIQKRKSKNKK